MPTNIVTRTIASDRSTSDRSNGAATIPAVNVRVWTSAPEGTSRNIFAIEGNVGFVVVDAPLRRSDGRAARDWLASLGKPVSAVLITHAHPDHTFGLTEMLGAKEVPIYATSSVTEGILSSEEAMQRVVPNFIGEEETERSRLFPNTVADPSMPMVIDGLPFTVTDYGEAESASDCVWTTTALPGAMFSGDLVLHRAHVSMFQGQSARYIAVAERLAREAGPQTMFMTGHGGLAPVGAIARQVAYIKAYRDAVRELSGGRPTLSDEEKAELVERMMIIEPSPLLSFLIAGGADAVARELVTSPETALA